MLLPAVSLIPVGTNVCHIDNSFSRTPHADLFIISVPREGTGHLYVPQIVRPLQTTAGGAKRDFLKVFK